MRLCGDASNVHKLESSMFKLRTEVEAIVQEYSAWATPKGDIPIYENVGSDFGADSAVATANMSTQRLKRSMESKM